MDLDSRKYRFIQKLCNVNESVLEQLENVLEKGVKEHICDEQFLEDALVAEAEEDIKKAMHGNICRCASYTRIHKAVALAATKMS